MANANRQMHHGAGRSGSVATVLGLALRLSTAARTGGRRAHVSRNLLLVVCFVTALAGCAQIDASRRIMDRALSDGPVPVGKAFSQAASETSVEKAEPSTEGDQLLQDVALSRSWFGEAWRNNGIPDAIDYHERGYDARLALFYRNPPRTLVFEQVPGLWATTVHQVADVKEVPRSIRRLTFGEGPMPPPWSVTKTASRAAEFGVPSELPAPPKPMDPAEFASAYSGISSDIRGATVEVRQGEPFDRASKAFARLNPSSKLPGFNWRLVVFQSSGKFAFGVPDGTIFLSDGLVSTLNNDELVAIVAHLLGHEAYDDDWAFWHDRKFWMEAGPAKKAGTVALATVLLGTVVLATAVSGGAAAAGAGDLVNRAAGMLATSTDYSLYQEVEANYIAVKYLGDVGIPPDTLFDALVRLASPTSQATASSLQTDRFTVDEFAFADHAKESAAELGKMLDTGMISKLDSGSLIQTR